MTDDLSRDIERIEVPSIPNDYASLKALIQTLPAPLSPEIRSASSGQTNTQSPGVTTAAQTAGVMGGVPPGMESGASIGVVSEIFYGNSNILNNPLLNTTDPGGDNFGTTNTPFAHYWQGKYVLNSGSAPYYIGTDQLYQRTQTDSNPLNSTLMEMNLEASAGPTDITAYIYPTVGVSPDTDLAYPFLVASCKIGWWGATVRPNTTKFQIRMEIVDGTGAVTAGPWFDMMPISGQGSVHRISVAMAKPTAGWSSSVKYPYLWRMRIDWAYNQAESPPKGDWFVWGEPSLAWSATQAPPPFAPIISSWVPNVFSARNFGDAGSRVDLQSAGLFIYNGNATGYSQLQVTYQGIYMGTGTTWADVALTRSGSRMFRISDPYGNGTGDEALQIGDDTTLFDVDIADRLGIKGQQDATAGGFVFGSGKDTNLYRGGTDQLKTDDSLWVGGSLLFGGENRIWRGSAGRTLVDANGTSYATELALQATSGQRAKIECRVAGDAESRFELFGDATLQGVQFGNGTNAPDTNLYRAAANHLKTDDLLEAAGGLTLKTVAGVVSDSNFDVDQSGNMALDTTNSRLYVRVGSTWKYVTLT